MSEAVMSSYQPNEVQTVLTRSRYPSGMTPSEINEAIELIRRIRDQGSTIVFVEHVMRAVMALADRVAVLNHGKLLAVGSVQEVMSNPEVVSAYLGKAHA